MQPSHWTGSPRTEKACAGCGKPLPAFRPANQKVHAECREAFAKKKGLAR
jgi:hypothetical protein